MGSLHEGQLETPGVAVSARAGQRGGLFPEGGIRAPRHLAILTVYQGVRIRSASPCAGSIFSHSFQNLEVS